MNHTYAFISELRNKTNKGKLIEVCNIQKINLHNAEHVFLKGRECLISIIIYGTFINMIRGHFKAGYKPFGFQNSPFSTTHEIIIKNANTVVTLTYMDICIIAYKTIRIF